MDSSKAGYERQFRSVFLRACEDMGEEKWKSLLFVLSVPESVTEKGRSDVLSYLVQSGQVSSDKPQELASLLRDDLRRDDLAVRVEAFMRKWEQARYLPPSTAESAASLPEPSAEKTTQRPALLPTASAVETRPRRRAHSPDRRYAKVFTPAEVESSLQLRDPRVTDEATPTDEAEEHRLLALKRLGVSCPQDGDGRCETPTRHIEIYGTLPRRRKSNLSLGRDSNCSSGYFSVRSSLVSRESIISLQSIPSVEEDVPFDTPSLSPLSLMDSSMPEPPTLSRLESSISSTSSTSSDEDFHSCSGSTEDLLDSKGIYPPPPTCDVPPTVCL